MPREINGNTFYTSAELSQILGISLTSISRKRREGKLRWTQIGHHRLTSEKELQSYLNGENNDRGAKIAIAEKLLKNLK